MSKAVYTGNLCPFKISGIPCFLVRDLDAYIVYDRKGYKADWLDRKMTQEEDYEAYEALNKFDELNGEPYDYR